MAVNLSSGNVTAEISGSVTAVSTSRNATTAAGSTDGSSTATLYTVPANKKARILSLCMTQNHWSAGNTGTSTAQLNGVNALQIRQRIDAAGTSGAVSATQSATWDYYNAPQIAATQTVTITGNLAGTHTSGAVSYIEEDA